MQHTITIGMDLGDKKHVVVVFDSNGYEILVAKVMNTKPGIIKFFKDYKGATVIIEAGTHSPWISRLLKEMGCSVYVGNPRKLRFIWDSKDKSDERDARMLGMVGRIEPRLLSPIKHRNSQSHADLAVIKSRDILIKSRTKLINHVAVLSKPMEDRLPSCSTESFVKRCTAHIPAALWPALEPVFNAITQVNQQIRELDAKIHQMCQQQILRQNVYNK